MDNLSDIVKQRSDYKQSRESKYKLDSKDRLSKILKKKIQTTNIDAELAQYDVEWLKYSVKIPMIPKKED